MYYAVVVPLGLQEESYTVGEDGGNVTVCVQLGDSPGLDWPVVMEVFTSPLTALGTTNTFSVWKLNHTYRKSVSLVVAPHWRYGAEICAILLLLRWPFR